MKYLFQDKNGAMYVPTMKSGAKYCFIDDALPPAPPEPEPSEWATHTIQYTKMSFDGVPSIAYGNIDPATVDGKKCGN